MSKVTIVEAAKQFNVTRPRIYRAIKKGELTATVSDDGVQLVQVNDMIRLFDNVKKKAVQKSVRATSSDTDLKMIKILEEQIRKAEEDKSFLKQQIQDIRKDFYDYKLRIEHQDRTQGNVSVTGNEQYKNDESLQVEHGTNNADSALNRKDITPQKQPIKKGLFSRLMKEILK